LDPSIVSCHAQNSINLVKEWCGSVGVDINEKLAVILFTRKRKFKISRLQLNGRCLEYEKQTKYLGITLDEKLCWGSHCRARATKAVVALAQCRRALGQKWGLRPAISLWLYSSVIRLALEYGALVWITAITHESNILPLIRAQGSALRGVLGVMRSTPLAAMEALTGTLPIAVRLQQVAIDTFTRLRLRNQWLSWRGVGRTFAVTHIDMCEKLTIKLWETGYPVDWERTFLAPDRKFSVIIRSRQDWARDGSPTFNGLVCWTDGSKMNGSAGASFIITRSTQQNLCVSKTIPLGKSTTVFQAELRAILEACEFLQCNLVDLSPVNICVDSKSSLHAITSGLKVGGLVREIADSLNNLVSKVTLTLHWVPSHQGIEGNEAADDLAKREMRFVGPEPSMAVSGATVKLAVRNWARKEHEILWTRTTGCRQSKLFLRRPLAPPGIVGLLKARSSVRLLTQIITGHNTLQYHLRNMGLAETANCLQCGHELVETSAHFVGFCERFGTLRYNRFGFDSLRPDQFLDIPLARLAQFIASSGRFNRAGDGSVQ
jgi:ribonuclease HI